MQLDYDDRIYDQNLGFMSVTLIPRNWSSLLNCRLTPHFYCGPHSGTGPDPRPEESSLSVTTAQFVVSVPAIDTGFTMLKLSGAGTVIQLIVVARDDHSRKKS